jgi:hypothetical protein
MTIHVTTVKKCEVANTNGNVVYKLTLTDDQVRIEHTPNRQHGVPFSSLCEAIMALAGQRQLPEVAGD